MYFLAVLAIALGMAMLVCQLVGQSTRLKSIGMKFASDIPGPQWVNSNRFGDALIFPLAQPASLYFCFYLNILTIGWVAMKFCTAIHGSQRMNCNQFALPAFYLTPSSGQNFLFVYFVLFCLFVFYLTKYL